MIFLEMVPKAAKGSNGAEDEIIARKTSIAVRKGKECETSYSKGNKCAAWVVWSFSRWT